MQNNPLAEWIANDTKLLQVLQKIEAENLDTKEKIAQRIFNDVGKFLKVPLQSDEITDDDYKGHEALNIEPNDVFSELAVINYIFSEEDIIGNTLQALYNVYHKDYFHLDNAAAIFFGDESNIPDEYPVYFFGDTIDARITFSLPNGLTWTEARAKSMQKIVKVK